MDSGTRTLIIINNAAARARSLWPKIESTLKGNGLRFETHATRHAGDATTTVRKALREGYRTIAVVGGDGTLSEAASGFFDFGEETAGSSERLPIPVNFDAALAVLPAGTGDDFARGLTGRREVVEEWTRKLVEHCRGESSARAIDVIAGSADDGAHRFICLNVVTLGLGAEVAGRVAAQKGIRRRLPGEARFVSAAVAALALWRERRVLVRVDEAESIECTSNLMAVANGLYAGGGMMFSPTARTDDGLLDVVLAYGITRATIMRELPRIRRGGHVANPNVRILKAKRVRIETPGDALLIEADGNVRGHTSAEFRIMPKALRVVV
jgi:diacylglycerol kinase (ATP)